MDIILPQRAQIQESLNVGRLEGKLCQTYSLSTIYDLLPMSLLKLTSFFLYFVRLDSGRCKTIRLQVLPDGYGERSVIVSTENSVLDSGHRAVVNRPTLGWAHVRQNDCVVFADGGGREWCPLWYWCCLRRA
jgi:hypothetical protein